MTTPNGDDVSDAGVARFSFLRVLATFVGSARKERAKGRIGIKRHQLNAWLTDIIGLLNSLQFDSRSLAGMTWPKGKYDY